MYTVVGRRACPYCQAAMRVLEETNLPYQFVDILQATDAEREQLYQLASQASTEVWRTVPMIWWTDAAGQRTFVGGYTELHERVRANPY